MVLKQILQRNMLSNNWTIPTSIKDLRSFLGFAGYYRRFVPGFMPAERNYPAHKLEFLALNWAVVDNFNDYLYGNSFQVGTDNNTLTYVLTKAKLDATSHRWLTALSTYFFSIKYRSCKTNVDAGVHGFKSGMSCYGVCQYVAASDRC